MAGNPFLNNLPRLSTGIRMAWREGYGLAELRGDILAGLTIGTVAVPLSMALAIATGVPPQHGLYTAIVAGLIIALTGGARFNVSGPTAAFVVILFPIVQQYGLGGLLLATLMAGVILIALGLCGMGRLIQYVPYPVVLGFTTGIAVVIALLQVPDFLGLEIGKLGEHFFDNLRRIGAALPSINIFEFVVGVFSLCVMIFWPRLRLPIPAPFIGLVAGTVTAYGVNHYFAGNGIAVETIASRFTWQIDGLSGQGIPAVAPTFSLPWAFPGADGQPLVVDFYLIRALLGPAFAIAILGAIESLLCAVVADGLTRTRHDPDSELIGQGLGNMVAPFFGGITATAALARTATNIRSGARSPLAAVIHSAVVLFAVIGLAQVLGMVPMAALAALLLITAWNMSEVRHFIFTLRSAPGGDIAVLVICFGLTVIFDMVLAVGVGIGLAAALFIRRMALLTESERVDTFAHLAMHDLPKDIAVYDVNGPMFFGAADKVLTSLRIVEPGIRTMIVDMEDVPTMDATAIAGLKLLLDDMNRHNIAVIFLGLQPRIIVKLRRAGIRKVRGKLAYCANIVRAKTIALRWDEAAKSPRDSH